MRTLFDGEVFVSYGQAYVVSDDDIDDRAEAFAGQSNGLCGAGVPGGLFLITATHTGTVWITVESHDDEPADDAEGWEEVVEVSFAPATSHVLLVEWAGERSSPLDLPEALYRVRYHASGMDAARESVARWPEQQEAPDRYLLRFWPDAAARADAVLRQTSANAAYWHDYARGLLPPPTPQERREAEERQQRERERQREVYRQQEETRRWGGRPPSERLRRVVGNVFGIATLDRDLVDAVADADAATQRRIARWAARHAYTFAGIADLDWVAPAWAALDRDEPLPEGFDDTIAMWDRATGETAVAYSTLGLVSYNRDPDLVGLLNHDVDPVMMALPALEAAALPDPLQAALEALWAAATAYGRDHPRFLAEVRRAFPDITGPVIG